MAALLPRLAVLLVSLFALVLLSASKPQALLAQECEPWMIDCGGEPGDPNPPAVTTLPATTSYAGSASTYNLSVTIEWCDDNSLSASTREILFRSQNVTGTFSYTTGTRTGCGAFATSSGTVTLQSGSNPLSASIQDAHTNVGSDSKSYTYTQVDSTLPPIVNLDFYRGNEHRSLGLCAEACFSVFHEQSTVPYISGDTPRNVTLAYNSDWAHPRPFVYGDVALQSGSMTPQTFSLQVKRASNNTFFDFVNGQNKLWFSGTSQPVRLAGQIDTRLDTTGVYDIVVVVSANYPGETETTEVNGRLIVVNQGNSPVARGWSIVGVPRLYRHSDSSALISDGATFAVFFQKCAANCYTSPPGVSSQLWKDTLVGGFKLLAQDGGFVQFNSLGQAIRSANRFGDTVGFHYDSLGRLDRIEDPVLRYLVPPYDDFSNDPRQYFELVYGANGLAEVRERQPMSGGRTTWFSVSAARTLDTITDPDSKATGFRYDDSLRLHKIINRRGDTTVHSYDDRSWKRTRTRLPLIPVDAGGGSTVLDSIVLQYTAWQTVGVPTTLTSAASPATAATASLFRAQVIDGEGHLTSWTVNGWGQPLVITDPDSGITTITRDGIKPTVISYPTGAVDSLAYSGMLLASAKPAGAARINYRYGDWAQVDSIWGNGVPGQRIFLGSNGTIDSVRVAGLVVARYTYLYEYPNGRLKGVSEIKDAANHTRRFFYGAFSNQDSTIAPGDRWAARVVDSHGRDSIVKRASMSSVTILYDRVNRVIAHHDGLNSDTTFFGYDGLFLNRVKDPKGQVYRFDVNALGWRTRAYDPADTSSRFTSYRYNRDGMLTSWTNRRGDSVRQRFDRLHRMVKRSGTNVVADSFAYPTRWRSVALNALSRKEIFLSTNNWVDSVVTEINGKKFRFRYRPNAWRMVDSIGIASNTSIAFTDRRGFWDTATGVLDSVRIGTATIRLGVDGERLVTSTTWPSSIVRSTGYTTLHQEGLTQFNNSTLNVAYWRSVAYDTVPRVRSYARKDGADYLYLTHQFSYDGLGRLVADSTSTEGCGASIADYGWPCGSSWSGAVSHSYDAAGNRVDGGLYQYGPGNRLNSEAYDLDGNQITRGSDSLRWDALGRLTRYRTSAGNVYEFDYDAEGQVIRKKVNGIASRHFLWEGAHLIAELDASASGRIAEYAYFPGIDAPIALVTGQYSVASQRYFQQDMLSNVVGVFSSGTVYEANRYQPWGNHEVGSTTSLADTNRLKWKGLVWDADVQLHYARNRWYNPTLGRFLTEDPIGLSGGLNLYTFGGNDPINRRDPFGLDHCSDSPPPPPPSEPEDPLVASMDADPCEPIGNCPPGMNWCPAGGQPGGWNGGGGPPDERDDPRKKRNPLLVVLKAMMCTAPNLISSMLPEGVTLYAGGALDFVAGVGATGGIGRFIDSRGSGYYVKGGFSMGWDPSLAIEAGFSTSFAGSSVEYQHAVAGMLAWGMTTTQAGRFTGFSVAGGLGPPTTTARMGASETVPIYLCTR